MNSSVITSILKYFKHQDGQLLIGGRPAADWADEYGTPLFIYDMGVVARKADCFRKAFPPEVKLYYAVKANPHPEVLRTMVSLVDGFDVASQGELDAVVEAGADPATLSFAGPGKQARELRRALQLSIGSINIESESEFVGLLALSEQLSLRPRISIRINPDFELHGSGMKMGGGPKQFGIDAERIPEILEKIKSAPADFQGFHIYAGSQNLRAQVIAEGMERSLELISHVAGDLAGSTRILNLGGGFGIPYYSGEEEIDIEFLGKKMAQLISDYHQRFPRANFVIELGRYLVGESGIYLTRVLYRKESRGRTFLVTDGGMNHHLAASGNFGQVLRKNFPIVLSQKLYSEHAKKVDIVGPLCTPLDLLGSQVSLPPVEEGDLLAILASGAYGYSASPLNFLSHQLPKEVIVKK